MIIRFNWELFCAHQNLASMRAETCHTLIVSLTAQGAHLSYIKKIHYKEKQIFLLNFHPVLRSILPGILFLQISAWFQPSLHSTLCSNVTFFWRPFLTTFSLKIKLPTPPLSITYCTLYCCFSIGFFEGWHITCLLTCLLLFSHITCFVRAGICFIHCDIPVSPFMFGTK